MTHAELVQRAAAWLRGSMRCEVVVTEQPRVMLREVPDAIGFTVRHCHVVECKTSISDLYAESRKSHARHKESMGDFRWIMAPPGVVRPDQVPEGHGLLEPRGSIVRRVVDAPRRQKNALAARRRERTFLFCELREATRVSPDASGTAPVQSAETCAPPPSTN